jgi:hypothetical protein
LKKNEKGNPPVVCNPIKFSLCKGYLGVAKPENAAKIRPYLGGSEIFSGGMEGSQLTWAWLNMMSTPGRFPWLPSLGNVGY